MALFLTIFTNFKNQMSKMKKGLRCFENYSDNYSAWLLKRVQESLEREKCLLYTSYMALYHTFV